MPATLVWVGDVSGLWGANSGGNTNWFNQTTLTPDVLPHNGDDIVFTTMSANHTQSNNLANLVPNSISLSDTNYIIGGNAITVDTITDSSSAGANVLNLPITGPITVAVNQASTRLALNGVISGSGALSKTGGGILRLAGASDNTYSGLTTVSAGTLELNKDNGTNFAVPGNLIIASGGIVRDATNFGGQIAHTAAVTVNAGGTWDLNDLGESIASLTVNGGSVTIGGGLCTAGSVTMTGGSITAGTFGRLQLSGNLTTIATSSTATISGGLDLNGATRTITVNEGVAAIDLDIAASIFSSGSAGLTKAGTGLLQLEGSASNTYTGVTTVSAGTLFLGKTGGTVAVAGDLTLNGSNGSSAIELAVNQIANTSSVTVSTGGSFSLNGQTDTIGALTVNGGGVNISTGTLTAGPVTMTGGSITSTGAGKLVLQGNLTTNTAPAAATISGTLNLGGQTCLCAVADGTADPDLDITAVVTSGGVLKSDTGTLLLRGSAANTYGFTTVSGGTLELGKTNGIVAVPSALTINNGTVRELDGNQIADAAPVIVSGGGTFDLNSQIDTIGAASVGGSVTIGTGTLTAGSVTMTAGSIASTGAGKLVLQGNVMTSVASDQATISGNLDLGNATRTFTINDGPALIDLEISAVITNGALTKDAGGTLRFSGGAANTYTGLTTVLAGLLELIKTGGVAAVAGDLTISGGVVNELLSDEIIDTSAVTVSTGGSLLANRETISLLIVDGGSVTIGLGALTAGPVAMTGGSITSTGAGRLILHGNVGSNSAPTTATISGNLDLGGATHNFAVADGPADPDLDISAVVQNGGLNKINTGALKLENLSANTYTGATVVAVGTLFLGGVAPAVPANLTITGGTVRELSGNQIADTSTVAVNPGGTLDINGQTDTVGAVTVAGGTLTTGGSTPGHLTAGNMSLNSSATLVMKLGTASSDRITANGTVAVGGTLSLNPTQALAIGTIILLIDNTGINAVSGTFAGLPEGATILGGGQLFAISYTGVTGNDVVVTRTGGPTVLSTKVNDGSAQRSRVTSLTVTFSAQVSFAGTVANAFTLTRTGGGAVTVLTADANVVNGVTVVTLSGFVGSETEFGSFKDGRYTLTALANQITFGGQQLDGNGDGTAGDNFTFGEAQGLFRFFGDINGDRHVDVADFGLFSSTFNLSTGQTGFLAAFDFNGDGHIDIADFGQFSIRFFTPLP